jgi:hypothetical protein
MLQKVGSSSGNVEMSRTKAAAPRPPWDCTTTTTAYLRALNLTELGTPTGIARKGRRGQGKGAEGGGGGGARGLHGEPRQGEGSEWGRRRQCARVARRGHRGRGKGADRGSGGGAQIGSGKAVRGMSGQGWARLGDLKPTWRCRVGFRYEAGVDRAGPEPIRK